MGWYTDAALEKAYAGAMLTGDITLHAKWIKLEISMPQTGDASMLSAWVCLLGAAGMGLKRRKK